MNKFKEGDLVRILDKGSISKATVGDVVTITKMRGPVIEEIEDWGCYIYNLNWYELVESAPTPHNKFKEGDRVRSIPKDYTPSPDVPLGSTGAVLDLDQTNLGGGVLVNVEWDHGVTKTIYIDYLELTEPKYCTRAVTAADFNYTEESLSPHPPQKHKDPFVGEGLEADALIDWCKGKSPTVDSMMYYPMLASKVTAAGHIGKFTGYEWHTDPLKKPNLIKRTMNRIKQALLSKDDKTLIKAGYLDSNLDLTPRGKDALQYITFEAYKKELVQMAKEDIEEAKAEECPV